MTTRLPPLLDRAILFAHRGARSASREQAIEGVSSAVRQGATGVHAQAWPTGDGVVVIDSSGVVRRFPRRRIADATHASLSDSFATLEDFFDAVEPVPLLLAGAEHAIDRIIAVARERDAVDRLWLVHDDLDVLSGWRDLAPEARLVNRTSVADLPLGPERRAAELAAATIDAVVMPEGDWSGGMVTLFHRFDVAAFADGANFERQLARLIDMGIDGVSGDHPARMAAVAATFVD